MLHEPNILWHCLDTKSSEHNQDAENQIESVWIYALCTTGGK